MKLLRGDCLDELKKLESCQIDSLITDPPAGISFMGKDWDNDKGGRDNWITWMTGVMKECLRVLKPGAHGLVWALPRTSHWTATACENAGFEVRDVVTHLFGTGFPKSLDISKAIDKAAGAERKVIGSMSQTNLKGDSYGTKQEKTVVNFTEPSTDAAKQWQGFGTALKPACEMWMLVRKPLGEKTVAANVIKHGSGGLNIDASRVEGVMKATLPSQLTGRFPANLVFSHTLFCTDEACDESCAVKMLNEQSGVLKTGGDPCKTKQKSTGMFGMGENIPVGGPSFAGDSGGASRFFMVIRDVEPAKPSECKVTFVPNAEKNLKTIQEIEKAAQEYFAPKSATLLIDLVNLYLNASSVENFAENIEINSALEVVKIKCKQDRLLNPYQDFTADFKNFIPIQSLALLADHLDNIDTIEIIQSLLKSCGYVLRATDANINKAFRELPIESGQTRFLYSAKASKSERNAGLEGMEAKRCGMMEDDNYPIKTGSGNLRDTRNQNHHPTVKAQKLMQYLIRMITPPNGTVLDPFMGSGSTGIAAKSLGFSFIGIERDEEYFEIAKRRVG